MKVKEPMELKKPMITKLPMEPIELKQFNEPMEPNTLKKIGFLPNPQKRFCRFENDCKCVERFKERIKKSTKPLKDLPVYPGEDPFFLETFLSSVEQKKGFVGKYETFKVSY